MNFRKTIFWLHLIAGLVAGIVILIMSVTGVALAFEKDIIAWSERSSRVVTPAAAANRLPLDHLLATVREAKKGERPSGITVDSDPNVAVLMSFGRTNSVYINPYTGAINPPSGTGTRSFMQLMLTWHRYVGAGEEGRALGKAITGACNAAFLFLAVSGLYLWWPRQWTKTALRAVTLMNFKLSGKARDWNWHNAVGFWCAPVLIVLTATAMPISYRWASDLIYKMTGSPIPAQGPAATPAVAVPEPPEDAKPLEFEALLLAAQKEIPNWKQIVLQTGGGGGGRRPERGGEGRSGEGRAKPNGETNSQPARAESRPAASAVNLTVKQIDQWPLFSSTQLSLDPYTGAVLRKEAFGDQSLGRKVRSWTRFLHTGEALGTAGKAIAGLVSAFAALLVWTGFALAWRRFFSRQPQDGAS